MSNSFTLDNVLSRIQRWAASPVVTTVQSANLPPCLHYLIWLQYSPNKHLVRNYYRPQTKFAKVMFLHLSICSQEGPASRGVCIWGCLHPGGLHPGGLHPGGSVSRQSPSIGYYGIKSTIGRYASYWNAFLFGIPQHFQCYTLVLQKGIDPISLISWCLGCQRFQTSYIIVFVEVTNYAILSMYPHIYADSRCLIAYLEMSSSLPNNNKNINNNAMVF